MSQGSLISFDGTDSSGKATQASALTERLRALGHQAGKFMTPDYETDIGKRLKQLFQGTAGSWDDLTWQEQMKLLADNRAQHRQEVLDILEAGGIVVYDRYVPSSIAHMAVDALSPEEIDEGREEIARRVEEYEYKNNGMPHGSLSVFLDVPPHVSNKLLETRKREQNESAEATDDVALQTRIYNEYLWLTSRDPAHYVRIKCLENGRLFKPEVISGLVWEAVTARIPRLSASARL